MLGGLCRTLNTTTENQEEKTMLKTKHISRAVGPISGSVIGRMAASFLRVRCR